MLEFNMPKNKSSKIKVIGVGGGGTNAVNHMYRLGIKDVDLIVSNTDRQSLDASPVLNKIQLGEKLTEGLGAGTNPARGKAAAEESLDQIKELLSYNTKMVFVTCGMGGGTGTGAAPVIAMAAKEMGLLTIGIVTTPFDYEGSKTRKQALDGIDELKKYVDAVIVISNETLREEYGDMDIDNAYGKADDVLAIAAKSIADCITAVGTQNVDFEDVRVALSNSGVAIIGNGSAEGTERARRAVEDALESKLLYDKDIKGAKFILINVTYGKKKITLDELNDIALFVHDKAGADTQIKQGRVFDDSLEDKISVTIIAAGFSNGVSKVNLSVENSVASSIIDIQPVLNQQNNIIIEPIQNSIMDVSNNRIEFRNDVVNQHEPIFF
ncbi:MAG: Cell division protein FtsZ, partial [Bacteroidota bacterium]